MQLHTKLKLLLLAAAFALLSACGGGGGGGGVPASTACVLGTGQLGTCTL